jgi:hypothetical protein
MGCQMTSATLKQLLEMTLKLSIAERDSKARKECHVKRIVLGVGVAPIERRDLL